jgi:hypothetical protein
VELLALLHLERKTDEKNALDEIKKRLDRRERN